MRYILKETFTLLEADLQDYASDIENTFPHLSGNIINWDKVFSESHPVAGDNAKLKEKTYQDLESNEVWDFYWKLEWSEAKEPVFDRILDPFEAETTNYGYTLNRNPFIKYLKALPEDIFMNLNGSVYNGIHNSVVRGILSDSALISKTKETASALLYNKHFIAGASLSQRDAEVALRIQHDILKFLDSRTSLSASDIGDEVNATLKNIIIENGIGNPQKIVGLVLNKNVDWTKETTLTTSSADCQVADATTTEYNLATLFPGIASKNKATVGKDAGQNATVAAQFLNSQKINTVEAVDKLIATVDIMYRDKALDIATIKAAGKGDSGVDAWAAIKRTVAWPTAVDRDSVKMVREYPQTISNAAQAKAVCVALASAYGSLNVLSKGS